MPDERIPKKVFYEELQEENRFQGGQRKRYKDTLKASLKDFNIPTESWEQAEQDQTKWCCLIRKGTAEYEAKRICEAERKRKEHKSRTKELSSELLHSEFTCSICNRQFTAQPSTNTQSYMNTYYLGFKIVFLIRDEKHLVMSAIKKIAHKHACIQALGQ